MQSDSSVLAATAIAARPATLPRPAIYAPRPLSGRLLEVARRKPLGVLGGAIVLVLILVAVFAPWLAPYPYDIGVAGERLQGPTLAHPFGTDANGRDLLSRIIWGARISVTIGFGAVAISTILA